MSKLPYAPRLDLQALLSVSTSRQALSWQPALASVCPSEPPCPQAGVGGSPGLSSETPSGKEVLWPVALAQGQARVVFGAGGRGWAGKELGRPRPQCRPGLGGGILIGGSHRRLAQGARGAAHLTARD